MERLTTETTRQLIRAAYKEVMAALSQPDNKLYIDAGGRRFYIKARKISMQEIYAMIADRIGLGHSESTIQKYVAEYLKERRPQ